MELEVFAAVTFTLRSSALWHRVVWLNTYQRFEGTCCPHLQGESNHTV
jgi:hypothetical protein